VYVFFKLFACGCRLYPAFGCQRLNVVVVVVWNVYLLTNVFVCVTEEMTTTTTSTTTTSTTTGTITTTSAGTTTTPSRQLVSSEKTKQS